MGVNNETGETTESTWDEDRAADEERAEDLREIERAEREREGIPHFEIKTRCAGCATELVVLVPAAYCDRCR